MAISLLGLVDSRHKSPHNIQFCIALSLLLMISHSFRLRGGARSPVLCGGACRWAAQKLTAPTVEYGHARPYPRVLRTDRYFSSSLEAGSGSGDGRSPSHKGYNHLEVESKWQQYWETHDVFKSVRRPGHKKKYILDMFPYPSGSGLHVGHPEGYTATDIMARYYRMRDFDVLHPMGWDAFGLPAEQHAVATGKHPEITTNENIATFKRQLKSLGFSYDWSRELSTTDKEYVRWTQWIFLKLFRAGLAHQSEVSVNWCPNLGTVLANEEVINGLSERGNHPVVRRPLRQWVLQITKYAGALEDGLSQLAWPEGTLQAQKQWIGRSEGALIKFAIPGGNSSRNIEVFTTRPDTLMGVTYLVLAPEHPLLKELTHPEADDAVKRYVELSASKSDLDRMSVATKKKTGVPLGTFVLHPLTGAEIPLWCADYVLGGYGTGAVMAVPAHDERDFEFAKEFSLPVKQVVQPTADTPDYTLPFLEQGVACNSGALLDGKPTAEVAKAVVNDLRASQRGEQRIMYKLRDWVFSRQRYWGEPIPIYFPIEFTPDDTIRNPRDPASRHRICYESPIPVEDSELPLPLPALSDFSPSDDPQGCLAKAVEWRYFQRDGKWFARETNTMPQWAGSCWYYIRFTDPRNSKALVGPEGLDWLPVDLYVGGQEHAVLHLLYARFWHKVLFDLGVVQQNEPFPKLVHQGMILGSDGEKMSKSRGNVVNPDSVVQEHGADALRLYEMFMGPLEAMKPWQTSQVQGVVRFRDRVYNIVNAVVSDSNTAGTRAKLSADEEEKLKRLMHRTIKKVTEDVESMNFNTAISTMMIYSNELSRLQKNTSLPSEYVSNLILLLSPFAPHVAEECWQLLGNRESLVRHPWPTFDENLCTVDTLKIAVQVNGKTRGVIDVDAGLGESEIQTLAMERVQSYVEKSKVKKTIFVKNKIINIVLEK